ncbi:MAG: DoxX family protein [Herpetosiphonaceae bacterium]|nr:DoxX family protein [Herpetosiphonaceae bacterium]
MVSATHIMSTGRLTVWTGRILSGVAILFLAFDGIIKILQLAPAVQSSIQLGLPGSVVPVIGVLEMVCLLIYVVPRTALLGAILLTGYLGGAVATQMHAGAALFPVVFPAIIGALVWGGLFLRDETLRTLMPLCQ